MCLSQKEPIFVRRTYICGECGNINTLCGSGLVCKPGNLCCAKFPSSVRRKRTRIESLYGACLSGMGMGTLCLQIMSSHTRYQIQNMRVWYYEISIPCVRIEDQYSTNNDKNKYHNNISNRNTSSSCAHSRLS